jgi:hypothetical protein
MDSSRPLLLFLLLLVTGACIAGCTYPSLASHEILPANTHNTTTAGVGSGAAISGTVGTWISEAPANSSGAAILAGAKELMKNLYSYTPDAPDYLPSSYSGEDLNRTSYRLHAWENTTVAWPTSGQGQLVWTSIPSDTPKGWSGITVNAGPLLSQGSPEPVTVQTDCSGFITSLFTYANTVHTTRFTGWKTSTPVPEAGCADPYGSCSTPNPVSYYHLITTGEDGAFTRVALEDLRPGDLIVYTYTVDNQYKGHVMLVAAVSSGGGTAVSRNVVVIDVTRLPHASDTRSLAGGGPGIGMGVAKLALSADGTLQYFRGVSDPAPAAVSVVIGRPL